MAEKTLSLKQNMIWNSIGSLVYLGCQWLTTIVVVRLQSGYEAAGVLSLAMAIGNLFTPFAIYKMRTFQVSDVKGEYSASQYMGFRLITIGLAFIGCMLYSAVTCQTSALLSILLYLVFKAGDIVIDVMHGLDQQHMRMDYIGISQIIRGVLSIVFFALGLWLTGSLEWAIAGMIFATVPVGYFFDYRKTRQFEPLRPCISRVDARRLLAMCLPAVVAALFCSFVLTVPRQYLSIAGGDAALGIYASVASPVVIVQMGATYLYTPLLGSFSALFLKRDSRAFLGLLGKVSVGIIAIACSCLLLFQLFGEWGLGVLYGESILPYTYLLYPMIICTIATAYLWFLSDILIATRNFKGNFIGNLATMVVSIPLTFIFVDAFGMNGVSFTGIAAYGIGVALLLISLFRSMSRRRIADGEPL